MVGGFLLIPIGGAEKAYGTRAFRPLLIASALIGACGVGAAVLSFTPAPLAGALLGVFLLGTILYAGVANFVLLKEGRS